MKKSAQEMGIYTLSKICPLAARKGQNCPSGRSPGRPANSHFYDRCASGRPPGRPDLNTESSCSLPVDRLVNRGQNQKAELSGGRPARSIGPPVQWSCTFVYIGRPNRSTDFYLGRPAGRPADNQVTIFKGLKLIFLSSIKSHKIT